MDRETVVHIINVLRRGTLSWKGRADCLRRFREPRIERTSKHGKPIYKYWYQCQDCKVWKRNENEFEVDHIVEVGPFNGNFDDYARRMYCEAENLTLLCIACHLRKTKKFTSALNLYKRKPIK